MHQQRTQLPRLSPEQATHVKALVEEAFGGYWDGFERYVTEPISCGHHEWRFSGQLGFGGKLRIDSYRGVYVDAYPEDMTPALAEAILCINDELADVDV